MHTYDRKWIFRTVIVLLIALFVMPLGVSAADKLDISGKTEVTVLKGKSYQLQLENVDELIKNANKIAPTGTADPAEGSTTSTITWTSTKKTVASVTSAGVLKAKKAGTTVVSAKVGSFLYYCKVTVNKPVTSVKLNKSSKTIKCGKTYTLRAAVKPTKNADTTVKWTSSNKKIAKVSSKGKVTAVGIGSCTITATAADGSGKKASCKIKVTEGTIGLSKTSMTLSVGNAQLLQVKNVTEKNLVWSSSDEKIATVSKDGTVTGVSSGTAEISVRKSSGKKTASCTVTVTDTPSTEGASARALQLLSILQKYSAQVEADYAAGNAWTYSNSGTSSTWKTASASKKKHKVNCALLPRWALREMGIIDSTNFWGVSGGGIEFKGNVKEQLLQYCDIIRVYKTPKQLLAEGNLLPGDICTWKEVQHTNVYAGDGLWYDAGRGVNYSSSTGQFTTFGPSAAMSMTSKTVGYIIRLK